MILLMASQIVVISNGERDLNNISA